MKFINKYWIVIFTWKQKPIYRCKKKLSGESNSSAPTRWKDKKCSASSSLMPERAGIFPLNEALGVIYHFFFRSFCFDFLQKYQFKAENTFRRSSTLDVSTFFCAFSVRVALSYLRFIISCTKYVYKQFVTQIIFQIRNDEQRMIASECQNKWHTA